jgi:hypothetical protein
MKIHTKIRKPIIRQMRLDIKNCKLDLTCLTNQPRRRPGTRRPSESRQCIWRDYLMSHANQSSLTRVRFEKKTFWPGSFLKYWLKRPKLKKNQVSQMKWCRDFAVRANLKSQFSIGRVQRWQFVLGWTTSLAGRLLSGRAPRSRFRLHFWVSCQLQSPSTEASGSSEPSFAY